MTEAERFMALAREDYECGCLRAAVRNLRKAIQLGNTDAMVELGHLYRKGEGVTRSAKKAFELFMQAANLDNARGMNMVGVLYSNGEGVKASDEKSYEWCLKAAEAGNAAGMYNISYNYFTGEIVEKDIEMGNQWLWRAAEGGYPDAMYDVAEMFIDAGEDKKAFEWMLKATQTGHVQASNELGMMYYNGIGVKKDIRMALNCFEGAMLFDDIDGTLNLARHYGNVENDLERAVKFYNMAIELGDQGALNELGDLYFKNELYDDALKCFETSAANESTYAMMALYFMYAEGAGVEQNLNLAFDYVKHAAELGNANAMSELGQIYSYDPDEYRNAIYWLKKAADKEYPDAILKLAELFEYNGDLKHAKYWYNRAVIANVQGAREKLRALHKKLKPKKF